MAFWHPVDRYMLAVWGDDFGAAAVPEALQQLTSVLSENFESKDSESSDPTDAAT